MSQKPISICYVLVTAIRFGHGGSYLESVDEDFDKLLYPARGLQEDMLFEKIYNEPSAGVTTSHRYVQRQRGWANSPEPSVTASV